MTMTYSIAKEFSTTPGGRLKKHGPYSGEEFRDDVLCKLLEDAIAADDKLIITLDGTAGYPSSFMEEAFGGLMRLGQFDHATVKRHLELRADDALYEPYRLSAERYMAAA